MPEATRCTALTAAISFGPTDAMYGCGNAPRQRDTRSHDEVLAYQDRGSERHQPSNLVAFKLAAKLKM